MAYITFEQVLSLPQMNHAKVISGLKEDLRVIKCGHVIEIPDLEQWIDSGELLFMTGIGLREIEHDLLNILEAIRRKNAAGLVIEVGPYIAELPQSVIDYSEEYQIPLITLPFDARMNDIMTSIYMMYYEISLGNDSVEAMLRKILYYEYDDSVLHSAVHLGYDPELPYRAVVIQPDHIIMEYSSAEMLYCLNNYFARNLSPEHKAFLLPDGSHYIIMLPCEPEMDKLKILHLLQGLQDKLASQYQDVTFSAGIGSPFLKMKDFKQSAIEAQNAMKLLRACKRTKEIRFYEDIGIYRLFFSMMDTDELVHMLGCYLGDLIAYDEENGTSFVDTLEVYLKHNKNIGISADKLYIHRNTLKYRVNKAESILKVDFEDAEVCFNIRLAYKIKRFLNDIHEMD